ncbi:hypothetical protein H6G81_33190 [Scytonema hofmannii FACHB-248]|uniref:Uncharacterized protein n=1 Tax=Scytonema hofmannii FACHB-248 TaxID=1842502 RepID=A0ABR8H1A7_9CYAN|nr:MULTISPECIES: hypothetical protein [Nostocales]MBD2609234.1 hypothetical protein [Scytonema hofmannii FACHB-248]
MTVGIHSGESLVSENNFVVRKQESTCEAKESSAKSPNELLGELPSAVQLDIQPEESKEDITSELPESQTEPPEPDSQLCHDDNFTSELYSESLDALPLVEANNHGMTSINSESPDDLLFSSSNSDESKDSLTAPLQLTGAALARRLNVSPSTLRHKKNARNFGQWTLGHDPDGIAWYFDGQKFISS